MSFPDQIPSKPKRKPSTVSSDGSKLGDDLSDTNSTAEKAANDVLQSILSPANSPTSSAAINSDPPESEDLIKALQELENAASSDATVRETIAKLPSAVSEVSALDNLKSPEDVKILMSEVRYATYVIMCYVMFMTADTIDLATQSHNEQRSIIYQVDHALGLLTKYNDRLQQELKDRRRVKKMIADYLAAQKDLETQAEERLEQYRDKLEKVNSVRDDLKSHIQVRVQHHVLHFARYYCPCLCHTESARPYQVARRHWGPGAVALGRGSLHQVTYFGRNWLKCIMELIEVTNGSFFYLVSSYLND